MSEPEVSRVEFKDWPGLASNADPLDLKPGAAQEQDNCYSPRAGELRARTGLRPVTFDT